MDARSHGTPGPAGQWSCASEGTDGPRDAGIQREGGVMFPKLLPSLKNNKKLPVLFSDLPFSHSLENPRRDLVGMGGNCSKVMANKPFNVE